MSQTPYPRGFLTPDGRPVSIKKMSAAMRAIRANPDADYPGWNWFPTSGHFILKSFRDGLNHRINLRGELARKANEAGTTAQSVFSIHKALQ